MCKKRFFSAFWCVFGFFSLNDLVFNHFLGQHTQEESLGETQRLNVPQQDNVQGGKAFAGFVKIGHVLLAGIGFSKGIPEPDHLLVCHVRNVLHALLAAEDVAEQVEVPQVKVR